MSDTRSTDTRSTVMPALHYRDAPAAMEWLSGVLGFERHAAYENPDGSIAHAEMTLGGGMIMLGSQREGEQSSRLRSPSQIGELETGSIYVIVPDADPVYARARSRGCTIVREIGSTDYGSREFAVRDPEGHTWTVGTYNPWPPRD